MKLFRRLFRPTVDGVLKNFNRTIHKLEKLEEDMREEMEVQAEVIRKAQEEQKAAEREALRSSSVADKLRSLISL